MVLDGKTLEPARSSFGQAGDGPPGEFYVAHDTHDMVANPAGYPYTVEVDVGRRFRMFTLPAWQPVSSEDSPIRHLSPGSWQLPVLR